MTLFTQRTKNTNDEATLSDAITLNATTSTTLDSGCTTSCRLYFAVINKTNFDVWLKLQAASVDNDKKGIFLPKKSIWEMTADNIYTGEISGISDTAPSVDIYINEY